MSEVRTFNVDCDESCHLEHDHIPVMAWGAASCSAGVARAIAEAVRALKAEQGLKPDFETKRTKVSFYLALVDLFLADGRLRFRRLARDGRLRGVSSTTADVASPSRSSLPA